MNRTNFTHAFIALAIQIAFAVLGLIIGAILGFPKAGLIAGAFNGGTTAGAWFISREQMGRQADIRIVTGVSAVDQKLIDSFRGWSLDAKLDALFPVIAVTVVFLLTILVV